MEITYDPAKDKENIAKHGISLREASRFLWRAAKMEEDRRKDYKEERFTATGFIGARLHVMVFTPRQGALRVISLRKANEREQKRYEKK